MHAPSAESGVFERGVEGHLGTIVAETKAWLFCRRETCIVAPNRHGDRDQQQRRGTVAGPDPAVTSLPVGASPQGLDATTGIRLARLLHRRAAPAKIAEVRQ